MEKSRGASSNDVLGRVSYILGGDTGGLVWELLLKIKEHLQPCVYFVERNLQ